MHTHWKVLVLAAMGIGGCAWPAAVHAVEKQAHGALV
jgi:hypothetical protein